ncbi:hypothetical protein E5676_scaffold289G00110 [Cucumis melo var. makuwa]|uniref:Uncharacterized protein n=1 Tax=Cucumis melo var. makuwa TaxID=1194695 RepID=A0A5D3DXF8_CUCMM|nr:hypothetical protein E5676_scaffold289G00110 [Cucumis melo var. makuwa]
MGVFITTSANRVQESNDISSNPHDPVGQNAEERMFDRFAQRLVDCFMPTTSTVDKRLRIEILKALEAMTFEGTTNPTDAKKWLSLIENKIRVMECPKDKKVKLAFCCKVVLKTNGLFIQQKLKE